MDIKNSYFKKRMEMSENSDETSGSTNTDSYDSSDFTSSDDSSSHDLYVPSGEDTDTS